MTTRASFLSLWIAFLIAVVLCVVAEGRLLSDGTGTRQQQIAEALKAGVEAYLTTR